MFTLALTAAALAVASPAVTEPPADPTQAFLDWAGAQGTPVSYAVCFAQPEQPITCDGLLGDEADGWEGVLVGFAPNLVGVPLTEFLSTSFTPATGAAQPAGSEAVPTGDSFGPGIQLVGTDIAAGTYRAVVPEDGDFTLCSWQRLSGLSGESDDIITIDLSTEAGAQVVVEILPTDVAFESSGCGTWEQIG